MRCDNAHANWARIGVWGIVNEGNNCVKCRGRGETWVEVGNKSTIYCCCGRVELSMLMSMSISSCLCRCRCRRRFRWCCIKFLPLLWQLTRVGVAVEFFAQATTPTSTTSTTSLTNFDPKKCIANRSEVKGLYSLSCCWWRWRRAQNIIISNHTLKIIWNDENGHKRRGMPDWSEELQLKLVWQRQRWD